MFRPLITNFITDPHCKRMAGNVCGEFSLYLGNGGEMDKESFPIFGGVLSDAVKVLSSMNTDNHKFI